MNPKAVGAILVLVGIVLAFTGWTFGAAGVLVVAAFLLGSTKGAEDYSRKTRGD